MRLKWLFITRPLGGKPLREGKTFDGGKDRSAKKAKGVYYGEGDKIY